MPAAQDDPLAALRRRVYGPGVTAADVAEYRDALTDVRQVDEAVDVTAPVPRRRRLAPIALICAAAVAAGAVAVAALLPATRPVQHASAGPSAIALPIPDSARARFAAALAAGRSADLADYFFTHPAARPLALTTLIRAATEEHSGTGSQTIRLEPSLEADHGGHLTVIVTLAVPGTAGWRATRVIPGTEHLHLVAEQTSPQVAGIPVSTTLAYTGAAPTRLAIATAAHWDALVVFSN